MLSVVLPHRKKLRSVEVKLTEQILTRAAERSQTRCAINHSLSRTAAAKARFGWRLPLY